MHVDSLETFYAKFRKHIALASSFSEKPGLEKIIKCCRLKPYDLVFKDYSQNLSLSHRWVDDHGNSLYVNKNKSLSITLNDASFNRSKWADTDLYGQLDIKKVASISSFLFYLEGKDEDTLEPHYILSFYGIDNYLRTFVFIYGEWNRYPSLFLGIEPLTLIVSNLTLGSHKEINLTRPAIYPCESQKTWLSCWPASNDFVSLMGRQNDSVVSLLGLHKGK